METIRYEIREKGIVRWGTVVLAKWLLDRALRDGHGSVDAVVLPPFAARLASRKG